MSCRIAYHSENGIEIGGSDILMGMLAEATARVGWEVCALVRPEYPVNSIFGTSCPKLLGTRAATADASSRDSHQQRPLRQTARWRSAVRACLPLPVRRALGYRQAARQTTTALREAKCDLFVTMDGGPQPTVVGAKRAGCHAVAVYNAPPPESLSDWLGRRQAIKAAKAADICVTVSEFTSRRWAAYLGCGDLRFRVIHNGIRLPTLDPSVGEFWRRKLDIPSRSIVVGMTGRMEPDKGPRVFAKAAIRLAGQFENAVFVFTGDGSELNAIRAEFQNCGLRHRVRLLGFCQEAPQIAAGYDIAVAPSIVQESFGLVIAEAMAWAKPVVASRVGGIPEVVGQGEAGLLVPANDEEALAKAIAQLISSEGMRRDLGCAGRKRVEQMFTRERMTGDYLNLFENLLGRRCGPE